MKYIKKYENLGIKKFWLLPTDKRFEKALNTINCELSKKRIFLNDKNNMRMNKYAYVCVDFEGVVPSWGWMPQYKDHNLIDSKEWFIDNGYIDFGYIGLTKKEIEKFEMKKNIVKYNL